MRLVAKTRTRERENDMAFLALLELGNGGHGSFMRIPSVQWHDRLAFSLESVLFVSVADLFLPHSYFCELWESTIHAYSTKINPPPPFFFFPSFPKPQDDIPFPDSLGRLTDQKQSVAVSAAKQKKSLIITKRLFFFFFFL